MARPPLVPASTHHPPRSIWEPILTTAQLRRFDSLIALWLLGLISFWVWWFQPSHHVRPAGTALASLVLAMEIVLPGYFFYFARRMRRVDPATPIPASWRVAMVVTKAPSEPWATVEPTLRAMLAQDHPHDTWLADEAPDEATEAWCRDHGVRISTRRGVSDYHRDRWPRKTRCKEGNLAYFYDHYGYDAYDFVCQLDADHVPAPGYLLRMLQPFVDPVIGYVAAPSICDANAATSWTARGRLYAEATLHGPLQAGYNDGWAPLCIGSHYAVRTAALRQIGGLGPELAEDHSTTYLFNYAGWRGAFQIDALASGDGPPSFTDGMVQEFQWSKSLAILLLQLNPGRLRFLPWRLRFEFIFAQLWYPLFGVTLLVMLALPTVALTFDLLMFRINYVLFLALSLGLTILTLLPIYYLRQLGHLRPARAPVISWEEIIFTIARGPWVIAGVLAGLIETLRRNQSEFRVTPKGEAGLLRPLPTRLIAPYLVIALLASLTALAVQHSSHAAGYYLLVLQLELLYLVTAIAVVALHYREQPGARLKVRQLLLLFSALALFVLAISTRLRQGALGLFGVSVPIGFQLQGDSAVFAKAPVSDPPGKSCTAFLRRSATPGQPPLFGVYDPGGAFDGRREVRIDHHFVTWRLDRVDELKAALAASDRRGRMPMISLEPWDWQGWNGQTRATLLSDISNGRYDPTIRRVMEELKRRGDRCVLLRFAHEMEIVDQYPWSKADGPGYIAAWRHIHGISRSMGLTNLLWVWSPAGFPSARLYWPGSDVVDLVGVSLYATPEWTNFINSGGHQLQSLERLIADKEWVARETGKPLLLTEVGVNASEALKKDWLRQAPSMVRRFPRVIGWMYFNQRQPPIVPLPIGLPDWALGPEQVNTLMHGIESEHDRPPGG